jgi:hypothetical protein
MPQGWQGELPGKGGITSSPLLRVREFPGELLLTIPAIVVPKEKTFQGAD